MADGDDESRLKARLKATYGVAKDSADFVRRASAATAAGAAGGARGAGQVIVKGMDFLRPRAQVPLLFLILVAGFQIYELSVNYGIPLEIRLFIYIVFFVIAWTGLKMDTRMVAAFCLISFIVPYAWQFIPKSGPFSMINSLMYLFALIFPLWLAISSHYEGLSSFLVFLIQMFLIFLIVWPLVQQTLQSTGLSEYVPKFDPRYGYKALQDSMDKTFGTINKIPGAITDAFNKRIEIATGDYYTGQVDQNSKKPIGVFIEKLEAADPEYYEGQKVVVLADIKAETLKDTIRMSPNCWSDKNRREEIDGMVIPPKLSVDTYDQRSFDCKFKSLKAGSRIITASATFSFETNAYLKTYFMDKDKIRSIRNIGNNPLDTYKIDDKNPIAIYTNGPVSVGMEVRSALPIGLKPGEVDPLSLGISVGNNWDGKIESLSELKIGLPNGIEIDTSSCSHLFKFDGLEDDYNVYSLDVASERALNPRIFSNIKSHQSLRCYLDVKDEYIDDLLGKTPITIKYFRASAKYDYTIEKEIPLEIKENEKLLPGSGGECGSKVVGRAKMGLGRPAQDGADWSSDSDPGSSDPISNSGFVGWVYSRYATVYKDTSASLSNSLSDQLSAGNQIDGNMQIPSNPNYDALVGGDLIFFCGSYDETSDSLTDCSDGVSHVGIYSGNGKIIHVGTKVVEESLQVMEQNYVGARRVCKAKVANDRDIDQGDARATVEAFASEYGIPKDVALGVAQVEGGFQHYASQSYAPVGYCDGKVKCGDLQYCSTGSIGMMQINSCAHPQCFNDEGIIYDGGGDMCKGAHACSGTDVRNIRCNVEASMKYLRGCYEEGQSNPRDGCLCGGIYTGWDYAIKCYNGCVCDKNPDYVANVLESGRILVG